MSFSTVFDLLGRSKSVSCFMVLDIMDVYKLVFLVVVVIVINTRKKVSVVAVVVRLLEHSYNLLQILE